MRLGESLGSTPDIAIATSILYLVPGIPFLNGFSDMIAGHYTCEGFVGVDAGNHGEQCRKKECLGRHSCTSGQEDGHGAGDQCCQS